MRPCCVAMSPDLSNSSVSRQAATSQGGGGDGQLDVHTSSWLSLFLSVEFPRSLPALCGPVLVHKRGAERRRGQSDVMYTQVPRYPLFLSAKFSRPLPAPAYACLLTENRKVVDGDANTRPAYQGR